MPRVGKAMDRKRVAHAPVCKCCGCSLAGCRPIKPFSEVYNRLCPERDGDMCERAERKAGT